MNDELEKSILRTLAYADLFYFPLKIQELSRFLITPAAADGEDLFRLTKQLTVEGKVGQSGGYYFLPGRSWLVKIRQEREVISGHKIKSVAGIIKILGAGSWVKLVAITGALSYYNSRLGDDVDVMIITKPGRLWLTRLVVFLVLKLLGRKENGRQRPGPNRLCINLWSDTENLAVPEDERDLVVASDTGHLLPMVNKDGTYEKFVEANLWIKSFLANWSP